MQYHRFHIANLNIILSGNEQGIAQVQIDNNTKAVHLSDDWQEAPERFTEAQNQIEEYFRGERNEFQLKLNPEGSEFQKKVWKQLQEIPYGESRSYKEIATQLGNDNASRAVGLANNRNPIPLIIPCHRVLGANKKLVGYAYGLELKKDLLEHELIHRSFQQLSSYYGNINRDDLGNGPSWWPAKHAFEMMIGAILTQNTNWKNVEKALEKLGENTKPESILDMPQEELAELIRSSGYHNQKSKKLKALCEWFSKYEFDIRKAREESKEKLREELLAIKGVGGETADSILVYALHKASFVIDAYTRRIFHRLGLEEPKDYEQFRLKMEKFIPQDVKQYDYYHGLIVEHAKAFCTKQAQCEQCPLEDICSKKMEHTQQKLKF